MVGVRKQDRVETFVGSCHLSARVVYSVPPSRVVPGSGVYFGIDSGDVHSDVYLKFTVVR